MWLVIIIAALTALYLTLGHMGMRKIRQERAKLKPHDNPLVSIIIPAYKSEKHIEAALKSIERLNYPKKEIILVNDSDDRTPDIARKYGAMVFQRDKREGKPSALNFAVSKARGDILFFLDADTVVLPDTLDKIVPWFSRKDISAVMPKYLVKNDKGLPSLAGVENSFTFGLLRMNMFFGTMTGFRGCGVAIRKSELLRLGGWPNTLMEDNDLAAAIVRSHRKIQWEPDAIIKTAEPEDKAELRKQKIRWGQGSFLTYARHWRFYMKAPQFLLFFLPYMFLGMLMANIFLLGLGMSILYSAPSLFVYIIYQLLLASLAMLLHTMIMVWSSGDRRNPLKVIEFAFLYFPYVTYYYFRGLVKGIRKKKNKRPELDFDYW